MSCTVPQFPLLDFICKSLHYSCYLRTNGTSTVTIDSSIVEQANPAMLALCLALKRSGCWQPRRDIRNCLRKGPLKREYSDRGFSIPQVTIKTGLTTPDGREELLTEYFCDHPGCPNIATNVLGHAAELRLVAVVCDEHAPRPQSNDRFPKRTY
jgi:hypothetical protein